MNMQTRAAPIMNYFYNYHHKCEEKVQPSIIPMRFYSEQSLKQLLTPS